MTYIVRLSSKAEKDIRKIPQHILDNLLGWIDEVQVEGLDEVRRIPGYHDEPLKGAWSGFRSIRLSRSYRAIYRVIQGEVRLVVIQEVNKHDY